MKPYGMVFMLCLASQALVAAPIGHDASPLRAGPMAGYSSMRSATLWLQGNGPQHVQVEYWNAQAPQQRQRTPTQILRHDDDYTAQVTLNTLEPGTRYNYQIWMQGKPVLATPLSFQTQALWQWRTDPPDFKVLTGSCAYINESAYDRPGKPYGGDYEIFDNMARQRPDMMLWLGDNLYFREVDYGSPGGMAYRYRHDRALPALQSLLRSGHHYAIWDDHDYGNNDANESFIFKKTSLRLFKRYWANPTYGLPGTPGVFTKASFNDVDFFMLDDRYYRNHDNAPDGPGKVMFGGRQMEWLKDALLNSQASFKVIANGNQLLNAHDVNEGWNHFHTEQQDFLKWLEASHIPGIVFLSGDRHFSELLKITRPNAYPLYELTCSPLTSSPYLNNHENKNPDALPGTVVAARNFCSLEFSGKRTERVMHVKVFGKDGQLFWQKDIAANELK